MTSNLAVTVRFPTGKFSGSSDGAPEWPPAPARVAAALLSVAGPDRRDAVEALFAAPPPVIDAPVGYPGMGATRWVPSHYRVLQEGRGKPQLQRGNLSRNDEYIGRKEPADAQPGVHVGDQQVVYTWASCGHLAGVLRDVAAEVPYLGRPTTPAILTVTANETTGAGPVLPGQVRYVPDEGGSHRAGVPSMEYLVSLDAVHESRSANRVVGFEQPVAVRRTTTQYRLVHPATGHGVRTASPQDALSWVAGQILYRVTSGQAVTDGDIRYCTDALAATLGASLVVPVLWSVGGTVPDGRLKAILVCDPTTGELPSVVEVPTRAGMAQLVYSPPDQVPQMSLEVWTARRLLGSSPLWTTVTPGYLGGDPTATLHAGESALELSAGQPVVGFATHPEPRAPWQPYFPERLESAHVSVQFADSVTGPLFLAVGGVNLPLIPAHPGRDDSDPQRGHVL